MKDLPARFDNNPTLIRAARDLYYRLKGGRTQVFLSHPELLLPESLKKEVFLIEMGTPSESEILEYLSVMGSDELWDIIDEALEEPR